MTRDSFVEVSLDAVRLAFPLQQIDRIVRAVAIHAVPGAPGCLLGSIDVAGELVAVYDTRRLVGLPGRALRLTDRIVLTRAPARCGFVVDDALGTVQPEALELADTFGMHAAGVRGVARTGDGLLLVQDVRRLLALERAIPIASHG